MRVQVGGTLLNRFFLSEKIGRGTYGEVYRAVDLLRNTNVAIKISRGDASMRENNILESEILEKLKAVDTPFRSLVVDMKSSYVLDDCVILVLELLSQTLLRSIATNELEGLDKISMYAKQMIQFLVFMSKMNIIHCDIKPENILVDKPNNVIKFADFGLSHCPWASSKMDVIQTLYYRAPEVLLGYDYDSSVDTWSVGCVLVECLLKKPLFKSWNEKDLIRTIAKVIGTPSQSVIRKAPNRDQLFRFDEDSQQWICTGFEKPVVPMGLRKYIETHYKTESIGPDFSMFIDLIENMLKLDPCQRCSPEVCLMFPFITRNKSYFSFQPDSPREPFLAEMSRISKGVNIGNGITDAAVHVFRHIKNVRVLMKQNKLAVMSSCLFLECQKINVRRTFKRFADATGVYEKDIRRIRRMVKQMVIQKIDPCKINRRKQNAFKCREVIGRNDMCDRQALENYNEIL